MENALHDTLRYADLLVTKDGTRLLPSKYQIDLFKFIEAGEGSAVVQAVAGSSKCLGPNVPVLMYTGEIKAAKNVRIGDLLMGPDSLPRKVLQLGDGMAPMYEVVPVKGAPWTCNDDHVLTLAGTNRFNGQTRDISVTEYLRLKREQRSFSRGWKLLRASTVKFGQSGQLEVEPYLAGVWLGDGTKSAAQFSLNDTIKAPIVQYLLKAASNYDAEAIVRQDRTCLTVCIRMGCRGKAGRHTPHILKRALRRLFVDSKGRKNIPLKYLTASVEDRLRLLAGLIDTDGTPMGKTSASGWSFTTKYTTLRDQMLFLCRSLGFAAYRGKDSIIKHRRYYHVHISGDLTCVPCLVAHKQQTMRYQIKRVNVTGFKLKAIGIGKYNGFTIDGDGRFLLGDFTVTHNTTSIVAAAKLLPISEKAVMLAFNKSIVDELTRKLPPHVKAQTTHSLCFKALNSSGQRLKVDGDRLNRLMNDLLTIPEKALRGQIRKLVSTAKANGVVPHSAEKLGAVGLLEDTDEFWDRTIATYSIEFENTWQESTAIDRARDLLKLSLEGRDGQIDFDDMLWLPIVYKMAFPKFDWIFVDEVQDLAPIQHEVLRRIAKPTSHVIGVGDSSQSIYQFRSAMADSMDVLAKSFNAKVLPLSICYRCAKLVVEQAKAIVPQIEAASSAEDGIVRYSLASISPDPKQQFAAFTPDAAVLCPYNAPMIEAAYIFIRRKIACRVLGREIGEGLIKLVRKLERDGATNVAQVEKALRSWYAEQMDRLEGKEAQIAAMIDKVDTLNVFLAELPANETVEKLIREIQNLFTDAASGYLVLSTIHRSKGLEYDKVFFLNAHFLEGDTRRGKNLQAWEVQQRANLRYVAITRARKELVFVTSEELKEAAEKAS